MDWVKLVYSIILLVCGTAIFVTSSSKNGDERKKFIHAKAQSYSFIVVIGVFVLHVAQSIVLSLLGSETYEGVSVSPVMFLTLISIIYLFTLLVYRKKYGD